MDNTVYYIYAMFSGSLLMGVLYRNREFLLDNLLIGAGGGIFGAALAAGMELPQTNLTSVIAGMSGIVVYDAFLHKRI
jgi:hypothetical protein